MQLYGNLFFVCQGNCFENVAAFQWMSLSAKIWIISDFSFVYDSASAQKKLRIRKKLKTEYKKLSLSEGRAYKVLQKFGEKKACSNDSMSAKPAQV